MEKEFLKDLKRKDLVEYHGQYINVFENFRNMYLETYKLNPAKRNITFSIGMGNRFKTSKVKLNLLADIDMLVIVGKGIIAGICHFIH